MNYWMRTDNIWRANFYLFIEFVERFQVLCAHPTYSFRYVVHCIDLQIDKTIQTWRRTKLKSDVDLRVNTSIW